MPTFSNKSLERLATCDPRLQDLMNEVIKETDIIIICGHRNKDEQNLAFIQGNSKLNYPKSRHNSLPSQAVDIAPYPLDWNDLEAFRELAIIVKEKAEELGIDIEWGGECFGSFIDMPHYQLKKEA